MNTTLQEALSTEFWLNHKIGDKYILHNRDGSEPICKLTYFPLLEYDEPRALVEIPTKDGNDFRVTPLHYLTKIK